MAFYPAPNIVQVEMRCNLDSQKIENRWNFDVQAPVTQTLVDDVTNLVSVWAQANYVAGLSSYLTVREFVGTDMSDINGFQHTIIPSGLVSGAINSIPLPNEVSFAIQLKSGSRGRSARGRSFVLGIPSSKVVQNTIDATYANDMASYFQQLITNAAAEGWPLVVVSHFSQKVRRPGGPVYFPVVTATYADLIVDSMKRRKPGIGT